MYTAKRAGKDRYVVFDDAMREACRRSLQLENDLRTAIGGPQLSLNYQPVVSLSSGEVRSVEVRPHWLHPSLGEISPAEFIPVAEESDLILSFGRWELESACRQMVEWLAVLGPLAPATISVNLSRKQFVRPDLLLTLQSVLATTGLDPSRLQLEVSEQAFGMDERAALAIAQSIRQLGIRLAIDDFGTGSSSLTAVHRLPIDTIKVNRAMPVSIEDSNDSAALLHALAVLVRNLGICMVADGVTNSRQAIALEELGCDCGQGDFFAAPLNVEEFLRFARRSSHNQFAAQGAMAFANRWSEKMVLSNFELPSSLQDA
jgi:EAL domain-containing protein (putative c-di-GMP-specific phosphodiesterase class I)